MGGQIKTLGCEWLARAPLKLLDPVLNKRVSLLLQSAEGACERTQARASTLRPVCQRARQRVTVGCGGAGDRLPEGQKDGSCRLQDARV